MITLTREEAQQVLDALEKPKSHQTIWLIKQLRSRLSAPEPEPVAWMHKQGNYTEPHLRQLDNDEIERGWTEKPLYTAPPQREWVGLTDEEARKTFEAHNCVISADLAGILARAIEAKLREKNT
jgi:hypothetical protein